MFNTSMRIVSHQTENINKVIEIIKINHIRILELKRIITKIKILLEDLHRFKQTEEGIREFENRSIEIIKTEEQKKMNIASETCGIL